MNSPNLIFRTVHINIETQIFVKFIVMFYNRVFDSISISIYFLNWSDLQYGSNN